MNDIKVASIETWRASLHMSRKTLADMIGVSEMTIARWEAGKSIPSGDSLIKLGKIFECGVDGIFLPFMATKSEQNNGNN